MNTRYMLPCVLAFLCSSFAWAEGLPKGSYVGVGVGTTEGSADAANLVANPARCSAAGAACSADQRNIAWKLYVGYPLSERLAVEAEYADLGKVMVGSVLQGGVADRYSQKTQGFGVSLVGKTKPLPNKPLSLYAKAGAFHWISKADAAFSPAVVGFGSSASRKQNGTAPLLGVGAEYNISPKWATRVGWDRYFKVGESKVMLDESTSTWRTLDTDMDVYSVAVTYSF